MQLNKLPSYGKLTHNDQLVVYAGNHAGLALPAVHVSLDEGPGDAGAGGHAQKPQDPGAPVARGQVGQPVEDRRAQVGGQHVAPGLRQQRVHVHVGTALAPT